MKNLTLMKHQQDAIDFAIKNRGVAAFYHEVGCGKTISALALFDKLREMRMDHQKRNRANMLKMLVVCPISLIHGAWTREIERFTDYKWADLHADRTIHPLTDIFLINFESMLSAKRFAHLQNLLSYSPSWLCVVDESSKMKNHKAKTVQQFLSLKSMFEHRIIMSGTPAPNIEWEYWSQMFFLNATILGRNFYKFKNTFFHLHRGKEFVPGQFMSRMAIRKLHEQGFKSELIASKREELFNQMRPWCHHVKAADCIDLPEEIDEFRIVEMTKKQQQVYKQMKEVYIAELPPGDNFAVANVALTKLMKLRQITSGFAINDKNEAIVLDEKNPKIAALEEIIEECGQQQMILWCQFHWEIDTLRKLLSKIAGVSELHGRISPKNRENHLNDFWSGKNRFLIAHPHSAAHGLTLTNCHISVFFSLDYSMEGYSQARGRIYRKGQKNNCIYFHLLAQNSIDQDVLRIVQRKETAQEVAQRYLRDTHGSENLSRSVREEPSNTDH